MTDIKLNVTSKKSGEIKLMYLTEQLSNCHKAQASVSSSDEGTSCFMCSECKRPCDLFYDKQITDTDRLNFIINAICDHDTINLAFDVEPHCRCGCCRSYCVEINDKKYFGDYLRDAIDNAMQGFGK